MPLSLNVVSILDQIELRVNGCRTKRYYRGDFPWSSIEEYHSTDRQFFIPLALAITTYAVEADISNAVN